MTCVVKFFCGNHSHARTHSSFVVSFTNGDDDVRGSRQTTCESFFSFFFENVSQLLARNCDAALWVNLALHTREQPAAADVSNLLALHRLSWGHPPPSSSPFTIHHHSFFWGIFASSSFLPSASTLFVFVFIAAGVCAPIFFLFFRRPHQNPKCFCL